MANIDDSEMKLVELIITNPEESELSDGKLKFKQNLQPIHLRFFLGADSDPDGDCELRHLVTASNRNMGLGPGCLRYFDR